MLLRKVYLSFWVLSGFLTVRDQALARPGVLASIRYLPARISVWRSVGRGVRVAARVADWGADGVCGHGDSLVFGSCLPGGVRGRERRVVKARPERFELPTF